MKVACPKCKKIIQAPDDWAGQKAKCPNCKKTIQLPNTDDSGAAEDLSFDLGSLGSLEVGGEPVVFERKGKPLSLKQAQKLAAEQAKGDDTGTDDGGFRTCPNCQRRVKSPDAYAEVLCPHCGAGIPPKTTSSSRRVSYRTDYDPMAKQATFYSGFTSSATYPIPALTSIGMGMLIALGSIALPVIAIVSLGKTLNLNTASKTDATDYGLLGVFITAMLGIQLVYFGSVAYGVMIETIRSSFARSDKPSGLTWNIVKMGPALVGYLVMVGGYGLVACLVAMFSTGVFPATTSDLAVLAQPDKVILLIVLAFGIPMHLIGLASSKPANGLHPLLVAKSLLGTLGHYVFLYLIFLLYVGFYIAAMVGVLSLVGPAIVKAVQEGVKAGILSLLGGLGAWAAIIGIGFYFAYALGRVLGLFARSYRSKMRFGDS